MLPHDGKHSPATSADAARRGDSASRRQAPGTRFPLRRLAIYGLLAVATYLAADRFLRAPQGVQHPAVGQPLANFPLEPLTGASPPEQLTDLQAEVVLLNLWGPWCPACVQELPHLAALAEQFSDEPNFRWIPLTVGPGGPDDLLELRQSTTQLLERQNLTGWSTYWDPLGQGRTALAQLLDTQRLALPMTVVLDSQQIVRGVWIGYLAGDETQMKTLIQELLTANQSG